MKPRYRLALALGAVLLVSLMLSSWLFRDDPPKDLTLDQFRAELADGNVESAEIKDRDNEVTGELTDGTKFTAVYPQEFADELTSEIADAEPPVELSVDQQQESFWLSLLASLLPILLLVGVFVFVMSQMQGGGSRVMKFGKAKTKAVDKDQPSVTFADVAGADEAVEELQEIKDFLRSPAKFQALGAKIPKGVLLFGPPGTGKTLLARAVAGEADAPFFSISGSDFVEMFVGVGASRVRDLFEQAKAAAPAIIFVDEIDAVGRHRGAGLGGGHDEREQTLNQLLVEMDGFDVAGGVILIAATNRPDILDPALLRPGRFDRQIVVDRPDLLGRRAILNVHAKGKPLDHDVDLDVVARRTPGFTGADLANLMNEAALLSARRDGERIDMAVLSDAMDRVIAGAERKNRVMSDKEKQVIAYHESGHALVGHLLPNTDPIHKVSIIARGRALGWTLALPTEDKYLSTRSELRDQLAMLLGGRTAEEMIFGDPTTGASDDIDRATSIAMAMVTEYGMSEALGPRRLGHKSGEVFLGKEMGHEPNYSDQVASDIDDEVRRLLDAAHDEAAEILTLHRATLDRMAEQLIEHETLDEDKLNALFADLDTWDGPAGGYSAAPPSAPSSNGGPERVHATQLGEAAGKPRRWWRP